MEKVNMKEIKCVGCGKSADEFGYDEENDSIYEDGSYDYETKRFVCDMCYIALVQAGCDVGTPKELIANILKLKVDK